MKRFFKASILILLVFSYLTSYSQKISAFEMEFLRAEKDYVKGDYKKAQAKSSALVKKIEKKFDKENLLRARALAQLAKVYEAQSKYEEYKTTIDLCVNTITHSPKDSVNEYGLTLVYTTEAFIQYGDIKNAQSMIENAMKLVQEGKLKDSVLASTIKSKLAEVYYHQGYLVKAEEMMPELVGFHKSRVVKKESYVDSKGRVKQQKLTSQELDSRARRVGELMNLYALITLENGNYAKTDSLLSSNAGYIRKKLSKNDVTYVENIFQRGLLLEAQQRHVEANEKFEKAGKNAVATKGIRWRPMSKQNIRIQEKRIISHKRSKRDQQAKKREKIYETRALRTYGKNSVYQAKDVLINAEMYLISRDYQKAEERVMEVLNNPLYFPKNHPERIRALKLLYLISLESDQYQKAEGALDQMVDVRKELHGDKAPAYYLANLDKANFHVVYSSKFKIAENIYGSDLQKVSNEIDHRNKNFLGYIYNYAALFEYTDRFEKALEMLAIAREDARQYYGENHPKYASALERTANIYIDLGRYADAENNLKIADEIFRKEAGSLDNKDYSHELETFARLYIIQGEYDEANKVLKKSLKKQSTGEEAKLSGAIDELAILNIETGKYQQTEKDLKESLRLKESKYGPVHRTLVNPLNQLGRLNLITGNYVEADKYAKRAASVSLEIFGESSIKFAESLKLLGNIYGSIGDYEKAEEAIEKALEIERHQYGRNHIQIAVSLNDIALIKFYNQEDPKKVESLLLEALQMTKESLSDKHPKYASILNNLALFYLETGELEKVESYLDQANAIWVSKFGENNVHTAEIYFIKGNAFYKKEKFLEAKTAYTSSRDIYRRVFNNNNHPGYLSAVSKIGQMSYIVGDYKEAIKSLNETTSSYLAFIQNYFPSLSEREKTKFWNKIQIDFEFYNTLVLKFKEVDPSLVSNTYNFALSTKALLLNSSIKVRQTIMESNDPVLVQLFEDWTAKKEFLTSAISLTEEQIKENGLDLKVLEAEIEALEKDLSSKSEVFAKNFQRKKPYDWKDIRKNLTENEVAIEIVRFRTFSKSFTDSVVYAALIITPETKSYPNIVVLKNGKELEQKWLNYYRNCMRFNLRDNNSYENFWKPVKELVKDGARVYLSPDGVYNQINMETLLATEDKYVLDQNEIILVSNTRDLISRKVELEKAAKGKNKNADQDVKKGKIALLGNPVYYSESFLSEENASELFIDSLLERGSNNNKKRISQLPGAEQEVKSLHELLISSGWDSEAYLNEHATEGKIKDLRNVKVFHIATHGFFMEDVKADLEGINQNKAVENPLLRSGLLLKDGGHLMEKESAYEFNSADGVLTAYEAMNLNFDNTDLVVLSACETGLGKVQLGEGVYGLQRSFLVAGAKTVVMSLFKVSDEITEELMTNFYKNWISTGDKRQSFIDAKKAIKDKYHNPIFWGAFIMVGME